MKKQAKQKIVIVGCGNVAWHLAKHLQSLRIFDLGIYNHARNPLLSEFKSKLACEIEVGLENINPEASFYFICVSDKYISKVAEHIKARNPQAVLLHTSGSSKIKELGNRVHATGVFYPLQTFSRNAQVKWSEVPIIIESSDESSRNRISDLASKFSKKVLSLTYKERLKLHLAAVLVNNFTNALYVSAFDLIHSESAGKDLNFDFLMPLIEQTTLKIKTMDPRIAQTGPAKRGDKGVMEKHLALLSKQKDLKKIYKQMSELISQQQNF